jgi:2-polyprenyl-3-methyl-5-hydroxy-6-metoxy-1,4-benzoquinol methylase
MLEFIGRGKRVLEFGCATGYMSKVMTERGCRVTGIEIDPIAAAEARAHCEEVIVADLDTRPLVDLLPGTPFDVAVFGDVLEHLRDPWRVLDEARAFIGPGGFAIMSIPNVAHGAVRLALLQGSFEYSDVGLLDNTHLRFFTLRSVRELCMRAGYRIEEIERTKVPMFTQTNDTVPHQDPNAFAPDLIASIEEDPEHDTLQFIVKAYPLADEERTDALFELYHDAELKLSAAQSELEKVKASIGDLRAQLQREEEREVLLSDYAQVAEDYERENATLRTRIAEIESELVALRDQSGALLREELAERVDAFATESAALAARLEESDATIALLRSQTERIADENRALRARAERESEDRELISASFEALLGKYEASVAASQAASNEAERKALQNLDALARERETRARVERELLAANGTFADQAATIERLESEIARRVEEHQALDALAAEALEQMRAERETMVLELEGLRAAISGKDAEFAGLWQRSQASMAQSQAAIEELERAVDERGRLLDEIRAERDRAVAEMDGAREALETSRIELSAFVERSDRIIAGLREQLGDSVVRLEKLSDERDALHRERAALLVDAASAEALREHLIGAEAAFSAEIERRESLLDELRAELVASEAARTSLIASARDEADSSAENAALVARLRQQLEDTRSAFELTLQSEISAVQARVGAEVASRDARLAEANERLRLAESSRANLLARVDSDRIAHERFIAERDRMISQLANDLAKTRSGIESIVAEMGEKRAALASLEERERTESLQRELGALGARYELVERELITTRANYRELESELVEARALEGEVATLQAQLDASLAESERAKSFEADLETLGKFLDATIADFEKRLARSASDDEARVAALESERARAEALQAELGALRSVAESERARVVSLEDELVVLRSAASEFRVRTEALDVELRTLRSDYTALQSAKAAAPTQQPMEGEAWAKALESEIEALRAARATLALERERSKNLEIELEAVRAVAAQRDAAKKNALMWENEFKQVYATYEREASKVRALESQMQVIVGSVNAHTESEIERLRREMAQIDGKIREIRESKFWRMKAAIAELRALPGRVLARRRRKKK